MPFIHAQDHPVRPTTVITVSMHPGAPVVVSDPPVVLFLPAFPAEGRTATVLEWGRELGRFILAVRSGTAGTESSDSVSTASAGLPTLECLVEFAAVNLDEARLRLVLAGITDGLGGPDVLSTSTIVLGTRLAPAEVNRAISIELALAQGTRIARELTNARANQLSPSDFAQRTEALATEHGIGFRKWSAEELATQGFGGITAIGQGSRRPPALVELWIPGTVAGDPDCAGTAEATTASATAHPPSGALAFAGKGITFDSGGLSLKSPEAMYSMHTDCAGAAAVLGAMAALAISGSPQPVHAVLPLAENVPGPESVLPGDVVTMRNGTGLEIVDTDFEGRVVLADALSLIGEHRPRAVVSLATLTYQAMIALGPDIAAVLARDEQLSGELLTAAKSAGEEVWPLPWARRYSEQIRSTAPGATLRNHPRSDTGRAITAALLLGEFVDPSVPFAHIDFAGPAVTHESGGVQATGWGVRLVHELAFTTRDSTHTIPSQLRPADEARGVTPLHTA